MKSLYVVFPAPGKVEVREETIVAPGPGEILCEAEKSLISIGTEMHCLRGVFDPARTGPIGCAIPSARLQHGRAGGRRRRGSDALPGGRPGDRLGHSPAPLQGGPGGLLPDSRRGQRRGRHLELPGRHDAARRAARRSRPGRTRGRGGPGILGQLVVQYVALQGARTIIAIDPRRDGWIWLEHMAPPMPWRWASSSAARRSRSSPAAGCWTPSMRSRASLNRWRRASRWSVSWAGDPAGRHADPTQQRLGPGVVSNSVGILGIHGTMVPEHASEFNPWTRDEAVALFFDYLLQGRMRVADLVTHRYAPREAQAVYQGLERDRSSVMGPSSTGAW